MIGMGIAVVPMQFDWRNHHEKATQARSEVSRHRATMVLRASRKSRPLPPLDCTIAAGTLAGDAAGAARTAVPRQRSGPAQSPSSDFAPDRQLGSGAD